MADFNSVAYAPPSGTIYDWRIITPIGISISNNGESASFIAPEIPTGTNHTHVRGRVKVTTPSGESETKWFSVNAVREDIITPQPPKNLILTANSSAVVDLNWDASPFVDGYKVYISNKSEIDPVDFDSHQNGFILEVSTTNTSFQGVQGKTYYATVTSTIDNLESVSWKEEAITVHTPTVSTVTSVTGRVWMDRNLGASRVATNPTDPEAYGD